VIRDDREQPVRVLVVEDDRRVRAALCGFLSAEGLRVVGDAETAAAALVLARERAPTVALVDVLLPEASDGLDLVRVLTSKLRIATVAISINDWVRGRALAAGAHGFLGKDDPPELLVVALRAAAAGRLSRAVTDSQAGTPHPERP
jgi:DNA-binding NarL/FixJ family response regulator